LSRRDLEEVVRSDKLRIETEDSLLALVLELGEDYADLLGSLQSEYLSVSGIDRLLNSISLWDVDESLWLSLCRRLRLQVEPSSKPAFRYYSRSKPFPLDPSRPFDGIICQLTRDCGGNVHTQGVVSITASSTCRNQCYQVVDYNSNEDWFSNNVPNSWIQFDFKNRRISVTNYTIKSDGIGADHLLQWWLDGSNDGNSWTRLDQQNTRELCGNFVVRTFACESMQSSPSSFRFIRLIQTGKDSSGNDHLGMTNLEFFGDLEGPSRDR
jgi:hypothetical protein